MRSHISSDAPYPPNRQSARAKKAGWRFRKRWILLVLLLGLAYRSVKAAIQQPQVILVLGGATEREKFAASFAQQHPHLPIWVSSGSNPEYSEWVFAEAGIPRDRVYLDYRAVDTVTNFTTLADEFKAKGITSVYLITSDDHMRRAWVIGEIVFGSRGIDFKPVEIETGRSPEPLGKAVRDAGRAALWVFTGDTGTDLVHWLKPSEPANH